METTGPDSQQPYQRLRSLLRQNSDRVGQVAEAVALPFNKRSIKRGAPTIHEDIPLDLEGQQEAVAKVTSVKEAPKEFPIFMVSISLIQAVLFYYGGEYVWLYLCFDPFRRHELWRYFTIMLVHSSASHLWGNVVFQLILGCLLEIVHHWKRISILYMSGVLGGSLVVTVLDPDSYGVGASAGVYALLTAHFATIIMNWNEMDNKCCRVFWLLLYILFDIGLNAYIELSLSRDTHTSHAGHLGGAITGFIVAVFVLRNFEKLPWEKKFQKVLAVILGGLFVLVVLFNVSFPSYYRNSVYSTDYLDTYIHDVIQEIHNSAPDSDIRKVCLADEECKNLLLEYSDKVNATMEMDYAVITSSTAPPFMDYDKASLPGS